jgi:hypothetical protein
MQKDVIYIDVEDDITAIIGKVKSAKEKVVALVPPKRTGVLQSAVNLRLLARAADNANKHLVLITGNAALSGLAASAKIPVAKNLQSRPELAEIPAIEVDDDVIDGDQIPVGEHVKASDASADEVIIPPSSIKGIDIDNESPRPKPSGPKAGTGAKKGIKVPNFGSFRKRMALAIGGGSLLVIFLIWAIWFAPHATVVISAKTSDQVLSVPVTLGAAVTTDSEQGHLESVEQQDKNTQSIEFDATGTKDIGEKATGSVKFSTSSFAGLGTIPAGTVLQSTGGLTFVTDAAVTLAYSGGMSASGTTTVTASDRGTKYNGASGSLSGAPSSVSAAFVDATAGGTEKIVKIVLQADVEKAKQQLAEQSADDMKKKMKEKFEDNVIVIDSSFVAKGGDPQASPAIGQEATGKAKLTQETTYTMMGVSKEQLGAYLDAAFKKTMTDQDEQKIYDNGMSTVKFADYKQNDGDQAGAASLTATAQIGPKINDTDIKDQVKGKRVGEIIGDLKSIEGVSDVNVNLSPFWVSGVPDDVKKISIEFKLVK